MTKKRERIGVMAERHTLNQEILGSIPTGGTMSILNHDTSTAYGSKTTRKEFRLRPDISEKLLTSIWTLLKLINEPHHEKTGFLPMRKQRRRSASLPRS